MGKLTVDVHRAIAYSVTPAAKFFSTIRNIGLLFEPNGGHKIICHYLNKGYDIAKYTEIPIN